ncbi:F-box domain-containing protein [Chloropicon primus]|uniref:F-box domain-containing protein n=1 Tax=Chloropicon primus TaxID=1764295 RepID=A0A5B8MRG0_9CHLO|nr:hypothetical protein A3770_09p54990 [Chloropicon primus]UPR02198.1 F-box domain-containing protein [Chloropicon primus]|eukprot:QDZ22981.1 hypothetical protein A3770_09p54990 [Chloropicon primus]
MEVDRELNVTDLPLDVQQKILAGLDWISLPKAALACKAWAVAVSRHTRSSSCGLEWSNAMFRGSPADSALLRGGPKSLPGAEAEFVKELLKGSGYLDKSTRPDLVVVTVTPSWEPKLQLISDALLEILPNGKSVHVVCCVAVGIIGTDEKGEVHEIEDGATEADAIAIALLHLGPDQKVFSMAENNSSARRRKKKFIGSDESQVQDSTLEEMAQFMRRNTSLDCCGSVGTRTWTCTCKRERSIMCFLVGDNVYDVSDMKTKIEKKFQNIHLMGGLCGYDTRKQAVYYSSPESRKHEEGMREGSKRGRDEGPRTRSSRASEGKQWKRPRISSVALFICNMRTMRASYRGIQQLMCDYKVERVEMDEDGAKLHSLRKLSESKGTYGRPIPMHEVLKELEEVHGSLHGVTFGVKRLSTVSIDSQDPCLMERGVSSREAEGGQTMTQVESVDIIRGVWDATTPGASRLEAIVVPLNLKPGDICSFYTYSSEESLKELDEIIETVGGGEKDCFGGFLVICNARGTYLHNGKQNVESSALVKALPKTPIIGFFANGEVGPMPYREYNHLAAWASVAQEGDLPRVSGTPQINTVLQGNTSVLTLVRRST